MVGVMLPKEVRKEPGKAVTMTQLEGAGRCCRNEDQTQLMII
jgi:hypothetical protein